jgi:probable rRNA maturation factor
MTTGRRGGADRPGQRRPAGAPGQLAVSVTVATPAGRSAKAGLARWLSGAAPRSARGSLSVALVTDARIRQLNRTFRGIDAATDVLSFPAGDRATREIGDIAIALGVARRQAAEHGHSLGVEVRILALHGLLHLLGYDHEQDHGAMRRFEERLRRRAGLPAGLIARARRVPAHS